MPEMWFIDSCLYSASN